MLLAGYACTTNAVDVKGSSVVIGSRAILEVYVYFMGFVDGVTIFTSVFLSAILSCLRLAGVCLPFILGAIIGDNKIDYKDNSKIKIATG